MYTDFDDSSNNNDFDNVKENYNSNDDNIDNAYDDKDTSMATILIRGSVKRFPPCESCSSSAA